MSSIELQDLSIGFGAADVVSGLDLAIADGEFLVLLGPSGCGKSTLLNAIAGLIETRGGAIRIAGRDVSGLEPKERGLAMVFQSYALYPNMDVYRNLAFALRVAGLPRSEIETRVARAAEILELTPLLRRRPAQLSGGQRQRVAIGRALVRDVDVFLFDEPLSNLDAQLRAELRLEIKQLHRRLGATMVYVTHDQVEALTLADRIAVMKGGVIQQVGEPEEIYRHPANRFVAGFLGSPPMNFIAGEIVPDQGRPAIRFGDRSLPISNGALAGGAAPGRKVDLGIRPEQIIVREEEPTDFSWPARVDLREPLGGEVLLWTDLAGTRIAIRTPVRRPIREGETVMAGFRLEDISIFDHETGERL